MRNFLIFIAVGFFLISCKTKTKEWSYSSTLKLEGINPIGITDSNGELWLSDGDHNRLVQIAEDGEILKQIDSLDRPMHIASHHQLLYVPQYGNDKIERFIPEDNLVVLNGFERSTVEFESDMPLDAPSAIAVFDVEMAIVDFYNNRILYRNSAEEWISFGKKGSYKGHFFYPTDVQITLDKIWVADAYNNRIQVFDKQGNFLQMIGQDQKMDAATGLFVSESEVFITDFENNRALVFDHTGQLKQELKKGIAKATDLLVKDDVLYIINYRKGELVLYNLQEKQE